jgi:hypothetical protein
MRSDRQKLRVGAGGRCAMGRRDPLFSRQFSRFGTWYTRCDRVGGILLEPSMVATLNDAMDLDLVAQRILQLVDLAVQEHVDGVSRSPAEGLMALLREEGMSGFDGFGRGIE